MYYREETYQIMGACFEVYKEKGNGFVEPVYQECLEIEFDLHKFCSNSAHPRSGSVTKGVELKQRYIPDFMCYEKIIVEIKAVSAADGRTPCPGAKSTPQRTGLHVRTAASNFGHHYASQSPDVIVVQNVFRRP